MMILPYHSLIFFPCNSNNFFCYIPGKHRSENSFEDFDDDSQKIFHATFGKQGFSWTFRPSEKGFDWTENSGWSNNRFDEQDAKSRTESHYKSFILGTYADRKILGLPTAGPLKIEDVKAA